MTFIARYQLDTPSSLLISKWPGNEATLLTFVVKTDTFFISGSESWRRGTSTFSGLQGPLLHKNSGPVNQRDPSTSCFAVSLPNASSAGLLFVSTYKPCVGIGYVPDLLHSVSNINVKPLGFIVNVSENYSAICPEDQNSFISGYSNSFLTNSLILAEVVAAANPSLGIVFCLRGATRAFPTMKEQWA